MGWPKRLVLVRHGESLGNTMTVDERATCEVSTHAYPLTPRGREQARVTGEWLRRTFGAFDVRYTSYYRRAQETMDLLCPGEESHVDARLAEANRGIFHTMTREEIERHFPFELKRKEKEGLYHFRPLGGENWPDIELRIHSFLTTLSRDYDDASVLIVVHGHWLILFQRLVERYSIAEAERRYREAVVKNASVTWYEPGRVCGRPRLVLKDANLVPWNGLVDEAPGAPA